MRRINIEYMATYKKRGYKPKTKTDKANAIEEQSATAEVFNTLDEGASRTEAVYLFSEPLPLNW